jgi:hypothetical protein
MDKETLEGEMIAMSEGFARVNFNGGFTFPSDNPEMKQERSWGWDDHMVRIRLLLASSHHDYGASICARVLLDMGSGRETKG